VHIRNNKLFTFQKKTKNLGNRIKLFIRKFLLLLSTVQFCESCNLTVHTICSMYLINTSYYYVI